MQRNKVPGSEIPHSIENDSTQSAYLQAPPCHSEGPKGPKNLVLYRDAPFQPLLSFSQPPCLPIPCLSPKLVPKYPNSLPPTKIQNTLSHFPTILGLYIRSAFCSSSSCPLTDHHRA